MESRLEAGGSSAYQLCLKAGDYVYLAVDQIGIDIVVRLVAADGRKIAEVDGPTGKYGTERLRWIADETGDYRCELQSLEKSAPAGRYRLRVVDLRSASRDDETRLTAFRAYLEGVRLRTQGRAESVRGSLEKYQEAAQLWHSVDEVQEEATSINDLGYACRLLSKYPEALRHYQSSLALRRQIADLPGEAQTLTNLGALYYLTGENRKAQEHYLEALALRRLEGNPQEEALLLSNIGEALTWIGDYQQALHRLREALPLHRVVGDRLRESFTLNNIGLVFAETGQYDQAVSFSLEALDAAEAHAKEVGNRRGVARVLHTLGLDYHRLGNAERALEFTRKALEARQVAGDRLGESQTLAQLGLLHTAKGEHEKAMEHYNHALKLQRSIGSRRDEAATLLLQGSALESSDLARSLECFQRALSLFRQVEDWRGEISSLFGVARVERRQGHLERALATIQPALDTVESIRRRATSPEMRISHLATHHPLFEFAIDVLMDLHRSFPSQGYAAAAFQISERVRARNLLESLAEARVDIRQGVDIDLLSSEKQLRERIDSKAERLVQMLNGPQGPEMAALLKKELESLVTHYRDIQAEIRSRSPEYAALTQPRTLTVQQIQRQIGEGTLLLEYALGNERSILWAVTSDSIQSHELPNRSVIESSARRVYQLLTVRNKPPGASGTEHRRQIMRHESSLAREVHHLSRMILDPVSDQLGSKRLVVVPDGVLQFLPFATLLVDLPGENPAINKTASWESTSSGAPAPLVLNHEILTLPSASVLGVLQRERPAPKQVSRLVALFADPVFSSNDSRIPTHSSSKEIASVRLPAESAQDTDVSSSARDVGVSGFPRLRFSRDEAEAIASLAEPASLVALGFDASRSKLLSTDLTQYRILHLGTHGLLNSSHPELSGLVLSLVDKHRQPQNGFLKLDDVFNLKLQADLVVLSACQTALGKESKGEGLVGLTRGFMYAGASRVLASLWNVDDRATAELMKHFYEGMLSRGMTPSAALQRAQLALRADKRWKSPYYWAGFILQGEWR